jgi:Holliday junction resolvase RusA-like endonuclease
MKQHIDYQFTHLNEYINLERGNLYKAAKIKRNETTIAHMIFKGKPKIPTPCILRFTWHTTSKRRDLDNIAFSKKFILDGMVKAKVLENDNLTHIIGLEDRFVISKKAGVTVEVMEG